MAETDNLRVAREYFAAILNAGDFSRADTLLHDAFVFRNPPVLTRGIPEFRAAIESVRSAFPDLRFTVHDEICEGEKVVIRWTVTGTHRGDFMGRAPSGRPIEVSGINIFRVAKGRIQEIWVNMDRVGEMQQLGWLTD